MLTHYPSKIKKTPNLTRRTRIFCIVWLLCLLLSGLSNLWGETSATFNSIFSVLLLLISSVACWFCIWGLRRWLAHPLFFLVGCILLQTAFSLSGIDTAQVSTRPPATALTNVIQPMAALLFTNLISGGIGVWGAIWAWRQHAAWRLLALAALFLQALPIILALWLTPRGAIEAWIDQSSNLIYIFPLMCMIVWAVIIGSIVAILELIHGFKREFSSRNVSSQ